MGHSDTAWRKFGKIDPYYGVLSEEKYRAGRVDRHKADFFAAGEEYVCEVLTLAQRHFPNSPNGSALDFGCGVGRLTIPLAERFSRVTGVDISPAMLDEARRNVEQMRAQNLEFRESSIGGLNLHDEKFDFVNTYIVLQHIPVSRGMNYMDEMLDALNVGGIASFHFTIDRHHNVYRSALYELQKRIPLVHGLANIIRRRPFLEPMMQMNEYSVPDVSRLFAKHGINNTFWTLFPHPRGDSMRVIGQKT